MSDNNNSSNNIIDNNSISNNNNNTTDNNELKECSNECKISSQCDKCGLCKFVPEKIPLYGPYTVRGLEPNTQYYYCTCGKTTIQQPLCDQKSCVGTQFTGIPFTLNKKQTLYLLCGCRYTKNPPHCDAFHTRLPFNPKDPPCQCDKKNNNISDNSFTNNSDNNNNTDNNNNNNDNSTKTSLCKTAIDW